MDRCAGGFGQIRDAAEMVVVAVRDQDRGALRAGTRELESKLRRLCTGIDDDRFRPAAVRAHDVTVRSNRPEFVTIHRERHGR